MSSVTVPWVLLARGPWRREEVSVTLEPAEPARDDRALAAIERAWERARAEASARGGSLWNGRIAGLASHRSSPDSLALGLGATDYRTLVGTNLSPDYLALPREQAPRADALGVSVVVLSGEHAILHRRGQGCFERPLEIDVPGGHIEPGKHDDERGVPSPFLAALEELEGELGVVPREVVSLRALALLRVLETEKPQLVLEARVLASPDEVRSRLASARDRFETAELIVLRRSELAEIARSKDLVAPAGRAAAALAAEMSG